VKLQDIGSDVTKNGSLVAAKVHLGSLEYLLEANTLSDTNILLNAADIKEAHPQGFDNFAVWVRAQTQEQAYVATDMTRGFSVHTDRL